MRLFEIIENDDEEYEDDESYSEYEIQDIISHVKNDCGEYLKMNPDHLNNILYRGRDLGDEYYIEEIPKTKRMPMDNYSTMHHLLNHVFSLGGFKSNRSNSLFCSGSASQAAQYGELNVVYPQNGFSFLYSNWFVDLYTQRAQLFDKIILPAVTNHDEIMREFDNNYDNLGDIFYELDKNRDIDLLIPSLKLSDIILKNKIIDYFQDSNIEAGIHHEHEMLISQAPVYLISSEFFNDHIIPNWEKYS